MTSAASGKELWERFMDTQEKEQSCSTKINPAYQCPWAKDSFAEITNFSDMLKFEHHGAHVMLWCPAKETDQMLDEYPLKYRIPMQIRFDGRLGFAGGLVDEMENFVPTTSGDNLKDELLEVIRNGLIREVREEMTVKVEAQPKYVFSSCSKEQLETLQSLENGERVPGYVMHMFSCQVPLSTLESMEKNFLEILSSDEVLGITRVPLYFMYDNVRGLPFFITNAFAGNALEQLMRALLAEGFLTEQQVRFAYYAASTLLPTFAK